MEAAALAGLPKIAEYAPCTVNSVACPVGSADEIEPPGIFLAVIAQRPVQPCVETGAGFPCLAGTGNNTM